MSVHWQLHYECARVRVDLEVPASIIPLFDEHPFSSGVKPPDNSPYGRGHITHQQSNHDQQSDKAKDPMITNTTGVDVK